jgi:phage tail sheath protein FI
MPNFYHGVEVVEVDSSFRDLQITSSSVIGLIGTAKDADAEIFPINKPVLLVSDKTEALQKLGADGTLSQAIQAIEGQQQSTIVVVRVTEGDDVPPYPTERITFRSLLVNNALQEVV